MRSLVRAIGVISGLYSLCAFASASTLSELSAASNDGEGVWVQLCASGRSIFIPLDKLADGALPSGNTPGAPEPEKANVACHACPDRRIDNNPDTDDCEA